jgi:hypothetical protein
MGEADMLNRDTVEMYIGEEGNGAWEDFMELPNDSMRRRDLRKAIQDWWWDTGAMEQHDADASELEDWLRSTADPDGLWEMYNPRTGKATKKLHLDFLALVRGEAPYSKDVYRVVFYHLTKTGFAAEFQKYNGDVEWIYFMQAAPKGYKRDWLYGGVKRE